MYPAPDRLQAAVDDQLAAGGVGDRPGDRSLQGRESEGDEQDHRDQQREKDAAGPLQDAHDRLVAYTDARYPSCNLETHCWHHSTAVSSGRMPLDASCW